MKQPLNDFCINHEKIALTIFGNMSIKLLLSPYPVVILKKLQINYLRKFNGTFKRCVGNISKFTLSLMIWRL